MPIQACARGSGLSTAAALLIGLVATLVTAAPSAAQGQDAFSRARNRMVDDEIVAAGVRDERVIRAMRETPRHEFVTAAQRAHAYYDMALPIGAGQTISPPFVVAYMTEQLDPQPTDKVLEIGTGSGYQAAVLGALAAEVYSIEIVEVLGRRASRTLKRLRYENVQTKIGDGFQGWAEHAPFDKIIVTCSPEQIPTPLVDQLKEGGRMVIPLGERYQQTLYLFQKQDGRLEREALRPTLFVPMTGAAEARRQVQPDPARPSILNGDFEASDGEPARPDGWHYLRQAELIAEEGAGNHYLKFSNRIAGRGSQVLQGFAVDGREVDLLDVSLRVRAENIRPGASAAEAAALVVTFYDARRATVARRGLGPWRGSFDWRAESVRIKVPPQAREAIIHIGLLGATGELDVDDVVLAAGGSAN